jgi:SAM-dependent methyltransferase
MGCRALRRLALAGVVRANARAKRLAIRLTRWTGKSREYVHPKHLLGDTGEQYWYLAWMTPGLRVLDVGSGHGMHALKAARRGGRVVGLDGDRRALALGLRSARAAGLPVSFAAADLEQGLPVRSGWADLVLCLDLLEHIVRRQALLGEIRRVLTPHGLLLLAVPNRATTWKRRLERAGLFAWSDPDHKVEYTLGELEDELARGGFAIERLLPTVYDTPLIGLVDLVGGVSLGAYRRLTALRRRLAVRWPEDNAGFYCVCRPLEGS